MWRMLRRLRISPTGMSQIGEELAGVFDLSLEFGLLFSAENHRALAPRNDDLFA